MTPCPFVVRQLAVQVVFWCYRRCSPCLLERLTRGAGLAGARRGRRTVTTRPDPAAARPPDLAERNFTAPAPNRLWVVEFTDVPTWSGTVFTALVTDVYSRRIVGW